MEIDVVILLRLICAHFISDFCLQSKRLVKDKKKGEKCRHINLLRHALVHAFIAYLFIWDLQMWLIPLVIGVTHYIIDLWKSSQKDKLCYFIVDQTLHLSVIVAIWLFYTKQWVITFESITAILNTTTFWKYLIGYIIILTPTSILLKLITSKWSIRLDCQGLKNAGAWIGCLERFLILTFM